MNRKNFRLAVFSAALMLAATPLYAQVPVPDARQYGLNLIGAPAAWALGYNGTGITVAVGDSGIQTNHPAFAGKIDPRSQNYRLHAPGGVLNATDVTDNTTDSHGTHVAGIIGASAIGGVPGNAFGANLVILRLTDSCPKGTSCSAPEIPNASASAIQYFSTLQNVMVFNGSYGPDSGKQQTVWAASTIDADEKAAILAALNNGKIIVAANGNDREENPIAGVNPNGMALYPFINPANANAGVYNDGGANFNFSDLHNAPGLVVAVTSIGQDKTIAGYAQTCGVTASWCVAAPGADQAKDPGIYSTLPVSTYGYMQGTSMAAPMVSGALAVLQQAFPTYTARDLAHVLFTTAENIGGKAGLNAVYGYGLIRLDRAVAGPTTLAAASDIAVNAQEVTYWSQPLTTAGAFSKSGAGTLMIAGRTNAMGDVAVNAGALGVGGTLTLQSQMSVAQGAQLSGFGRVIGNTTIAGTLDVGQLPNYADLKANNAGVIPADIPLSGASVGTLTFQGNVTLTATATMIENIDGTLTIPGGPGTFDKTIVTGAGSTFTAGGTLAPTLRNIVGGNNNYTPVVGTNFLIVSAQNGAAVAGQFATLAQPATGLGANTRFDVVYTATGITLNITPLNFAAQVAGNNTNRNVQAIAQALDAERPAPGIAPRGKAKTLFDDLYDNSEAEDDIELEDLTGEGLAGMGAIGFAAFANVSDHIGQHQTLLIANDVVQPAQLASATGWSAWGSAFGNWSRINDDGLPGSHSGAMGFTLGTDAQFDTDLRLGAAFGYSRTLTNSFDARSDAKSYVGALYATWTPDDFNIQARIATGPLSLSTARIITVTGTSELAEGNAGGWGSVLAASLGYRFAIGDLMLEPYVGITAQHSTRNAFTETSTYGLDFLSQTLGRAVTEVGAQASTSFVIESFTIMPQVKLAWTHGIGDEGFDTRAELFSTPFEIYGAEPGRDAAKLSVDINAWQTGAVSVFVGYTGEVRRNATSHEARGGARIALN